MEGCFKQKKILITDAGQELGQALVHPLCSVGADVYVMSSQAQSLVMLKALWPDLHTFTVDKSKWMEFRHTLHNLPLIHYVINLDNHSEIGHFLELHHHDFERSINKGLMATANLCQMMISKLVSQEKKGSIVNVCHINSQDSSIPQNVSVAAIKQLTSDLAKEFGDKGIRSNCVLWKSDLVDKREESEPFFTTERLKQVVDVILFLLSNQSELINGAAIPIEAKIGQSKEDESDILHKFCKN